MPTNFFETLRAEAEKNLNPQTPAEEPKPGEAAKPLEQAAEEAPDLTAQLAEKDKEIEKLLKRVKDTHAWANETSMAKAVGDAVATALMQKDQIERQLAEHRGMSQRPQLDLSKADYDTILSDPRAFREFIGHIREHSDKTAEWAVNYALSQVQPWLAQLAPLQRLAPAAQPLLQKQAISEARQMSVDEGIVSDGDQFDELIGDALGVIDQYEKDNPQLAGEADRYRLDASMLSHLVGLVLRRNNGAKSPGKRKETPVPKGDVSVKPGSDAAPNPFLGEVSKVLGTKLDPEKFKKFKNAAGY